MANWIANGNMEVSEEYLIGAGMSQRDRAFYKKWQKAHFFAAHNCPEIDYMTFTAIGLAVRLAGSGMCFEFMDPEEALKAFEKKIYQKD